MSWTLQGRVAFITGAARGIGAGVARRLAARGVRVALVGLEADRLAALANELGQGHVWFECDVTSQYALDAAVAHVTCELGRIDVVMANAGIATFGPAVTTAPDAMARVIDVNLTGVIRTVSATLDAMIAARGYYLLVASAASFAPMPGLAAYAASKSGVEQFANAFRYEVAYRGIDVGSAHPCWIDTDLVRDAHDDLPAFRAILARLPPPFGTITSIDRCVDGLVGAIERRARRTYVPRALVPFALLRHVLVTPPFDVILRRNAAQSVPDLERDSQTIGRSFGLHSVESPRTSVPRRG
jgi:NAD(P)-dependent dehydrogenase (short-subunit alcohol dehydrogenase family)